MAETLQELLELDDETLFSRAQSVRKDRKHVSWSPNLINPACATTPRCRHCKWECFKSEREMFEARRPVDDVLRQAEKQVQMGVDRILMPSGWMGYDLPDYFFDTVRAVKERFSVEVFGLSGSIHRSSLEGLKQAGMDGYQCGLESVNETIYRKFRPGGDSLADRLETIQNVKDLGMKLWSGFVLGFDLPMEDIIGSLELLKSLKVDCLGVQPFIPFPHTDLAAEDPVNPHFWARILAVAGIYMPDCDLVSTENDGPHGRFARLTGANSFPVFMHSMARKQA